MVVVDALRPRRPPYSCPACGKKLLALMILKHHMLRFHAEIFPSQQHMLQTPDTSFEDTHQGQCYGV